LDLPVWDRASAAPHPARAHAPITDIAAASQRGDLADPVPPGLIADIQLLRGAAQT